MSGSEGASAPISDALLARLARVPVAEGAELLRAANLWSPDAAWQLATTALDHAERVPQEAAAWLDVAQEMAADFGDPARLLGQIGYAQARVAVHQGELAAAEARLRAAQEIWATAGAEELVARSRLGLTQVLAMQGRYAEAEAENRAALAWLDQAGEEPETLILLARAQRNLATLRVVQDRHTAAIVSYLAARATLERVAAVVPRDAAVAMQAELAHLALNLASAYTFLEDQRRAEEELQTAMRLFRALGDDVNRGRAAANLGRLYARMGDYGAALAAFDEAASLLESPQGDLVGEDSAQDRDARLADELRLERAMIYLALNLLPEATTALERCAQEFAASGQPYELAQTRYTQGAVAARRRDWETARARLAEALAIYRQLGNRYWANRAMVALAEVAFLQGEPVVARTTLGVLPERVEVDPQDGALLWDLATLGQAWLLRLRIGLAEGDLAAAMTAEQVATALLSASGDAALIETVQFPHLVLMLLHSRGLLSRAQGDPAATRWFALAADLLEAQRRRLPADEVRAAFLDDKMAIYADWVTALLEPVDADTADLALAFGVVERARARILLERLLASVSTVSSSEAQAPADRAETEQLAREREAVRRRLSELYNSLLGLGDRRGGAPDVLDEVTQVERALQALEWRSSTIPAATVEAGLEELQAILTPDRQAVVYFIAREEILAFVVSAQNVQVVRRLCTLHDLETAQRDLRFQLGRMELDGARVRRRSEHYLRGANQVLHRLYRLLVQPVRARLTGPQLLILPYGALHFVPFHALWDGEHYLVERYEPVYAPSAAFLVRRMTPAPGAASVWETGTTNGGWGYTARFAGFAPTDATIPAADVEVMAAAACFRSASTWLGERATREALQRCAGAADVLHLATHGLFRLDNPFFSALKLTDGWLDVREIQRLQTTAHLVVLSACESGAGQVRGGDEVIGLARGFLAAGARAVVASLWNVHDRSAEGLMAAFYRALASGGKSPAAALAQAQRAAIARGQHPYYWAPFVAIGAFET